MSDIPAVVALGDFVRDPITGFQGCVTSITRFLYGCERCCVQATQTDKDGKTGPTEHFDVAGLVVVQHGKFLPRPTNYALPPGGPGRIGDDAGHRPISPR